MKYLFFVFVLFSHVAFCDTYTGKIKSIHIKREYGGYSFLVQIDQANGVFQGTQCQPSSPLGLIYRNRAFPQRLQELANSSFEDWAKQSVIDADTAAFQMVYSLALSAILADMNAEIACFTPGEIGEIKFPVD